MNHRRAFWHGWRNRMMDLRELPSDDASRQLASEWVEEMRGIEERIKVDD